MFNHKMGVPYAGVNCPLHGQIDIDYDNYMDQMNNRWSKWRCPKCGMDSEFDDDSYRGDRDAQ